MKRLILISFLLFQKLAFGQITAPDTVVLRIDPEIAKGSTAGKTYTEVNYIPLQNSEQCVVGEISKLEVVDNYFIVFDRGLDQILIFNKDGSFHAKCAPIPGLHKNASMMNNFNFNVFGDLAINRAKQEIVVKTRLDRENLYIFNYEGDLQGKVSLGTKSNVKRFWGFAYLDSSRCIYTGRPFSLEQDSVSKAYLLCISDHFSSVLKEEISFSPRDISKRGVVLTTLDGPFYQSGTAGECFFSHSYDYNLYLINGNGIGKVYKVLLPADYSLPCDFLTNEKKYKSGAEYLLNNSQKVYAITDVYHMGDYLFFKLNNSQYDDKNTFFYNLQTGSLFNMLNVSLDDFSSFLPVINNNGSIQACDGKYIYSSFSSLELFDANAVSRDKHPQYPPQLKKYFSVQTRKSNPVIVQAKLHPNL